MSRGNDDTLKRRSIYVEFYKRPKAVVSPGVVPPVARLIQ
jgi:hypothetical protein